MTRVFAPASMKALQSEDALAGVDLPQAGFTGGKHNQFRVEQVEAGHVLGGQQAVLGLLGGDPPASQVLAPASARPRRSSGFSGSGPESRPGPSVPIGLGKSTLLARSSRKKPCVAR